ncbi:hypothetical protein CONCODRAFT_12940 [Conidiobolus coronatus NRRL 28638]|uniref:Uncharacterized protein n=1 Tax=Conidiobolus coronatus (strain ATCC 28846 / CBS 209.66 / NRRL 28638) TaxID=796925 RepID=A0A137NRT7_CONC2|nr:hypothetical protein CONCODRAFT_12940 [Conidiobolus coronatus NRRL 28638]|eukprot:KXN65461.1 hypothetical protein CONCODRAFT_12940 [Conidiobolus coronatus NRRL 28638]
MYIKRAPETTTNSDNSGRELLEDKFDFESNAEFACEFMDEYVRAVHNKCECVARIYLRELGYDLEPGTCCNYTHVPNGVRSWIEWLGVKVDDAPKIARMLDARSECMQCGMYGRKTLQAAKAVSKSDVMTDMGGGRGMKLYFYSSMVGVQRASEDEDLARALVLDVAKDGAPWRPVANIACRGALERFLQEQDAVQSHMRPSQLVRFCMSGGLYASIVCRALTGTATVRSAVAKDILFDIVSAGAGRNYYCRCSYASALKTGYEFVVAGYLVMSAIATIAHEETNIQAHSYTLMSLLENVRSRRICVSAKGAWLRGRREDCGPVAEWLNRGADYSKWFDDCTYRSLTIDECLKRISEAKSTGVLADHRIVLQSKGAHLATQYAISRGEKRYLAEANCVDADYEIMNTGIDVGGFPLIHHSIHDRARAEDMVQADVVKPEVVGPPTRDDCEYANTFSSYVTDSQIVCMTRSVGVEPAHQPSAGCGLYEWCDMCGRAGKNVTSVVLCGLSGIAQSVLVHVAASGMPVLPEHLRGAVESLSLPSANPNERIARSYGVIQTVLDFVAGCALGGKDYIQDVEEWSSVRGVPRHGLVDVWYARVVVEACRYTGAGTPSVVFRVIVFLFSFQLAAGLIGEGRDIDLDSCKRECEENFKNCKLGVLKCKQIKTKCDVNCECGDKDKFELTFASECNLDGTAKEE